MSGEFQTKEVQFYNLDAIISVGYRVNSRKATAFRQWATSVLKQYMHKGYVVNHNAVSEQKYEDLKPAGCSLRRLCERSEQNRWGTFFQNLCSISIQTHYLVMPGLTGHLLYNIWVNNYVTG